MNWYKLDENRNPVLIGDAIEHVRWIAEYDEECREMFKGMLGYWRTYMYENPPTPLATVEQIMRN